MIAPKPVTRCESARRAYEAGEINHAELTAVFHKWLRRVPLGKRHTRLVEFAYRTTETRAATALYRDKPRP